jgi:hypothetical protein
VNPARVNPARVPRRAGALAIAVMALLVTGCSIARVVGPTPDSLAAWSDTPLPPDAGLTALALAADSSCIGANNGGPIRILIQDRRTPQTAAFLVASANTFGSCVVTSAGGMSSGGSGPALGPMTALLSVDDNGAGGSGAGQIRELGGRVAPDAAQVTVQLKDGRSVHASLANGYWLAWWPDTTTAQHVVATDAAGAEVATVEVEV